MFSFSSVTLTRYRNHFLSLFPFEKRWQGSVAPTGVEKPNYWTHCFICVLPKVILADLINSYLCFAYLYAAEERQKGTFRLGVPYLCFDGI